MSGPGVYRDAQAGAAHPLQPRVALLGGAFDPVHNGHLHIAEVVLATGAYDQVLFVPAHLPSHKPGALAAPNHRLSMLRLAISRRRGLAVSDIELRRGGVSYTVDTVRQLQHDGTLGMRPGLVVGDDLGADLETWREAEALFGMVELLVACRTPQTGPLAFPHRRLANHPLPLSSSMLRRRVRAGQVIRALVPDSVHAYIRKHGLYGRCGDH